MVSPACERSPSGSIPIASLINSDMDQYYPSGSRDEDLSDADSAYGGDSLIGDDTKTLSTYITDYRYEFGRRYHSYRDGAYWVGCHRPVVSPCSFC